MSLESRIKYMERALPLTLVTHLISEVKYDITLEEYYMVISRVYDEFVNSLPWDYYTRVRKGI